MLEWFKVIWNNSGYDTKMDFIKTIITTAGVLISAIGSVRIFTKNKKKEINFKIHEQRKIKYEEYLGLIRKIFGNSEVILAGEELPFNQDEWLNAQFGLNLYASDKVIHKANKIRDGGSNNIEIVFELGSMILLMRKEIGLDNKKISIRECLSSFINDINETKHDKDYKNYMKKQKKFYKIYLKFKNLIQYIRRLVKEKRIVKIQK